jgi:hypothetical protein
MDEAAKEKPVRPKAPAYISCKMDEFERLRTLGFRERWLYMELKWIANFKTGVGGAWGNQKITYEDLAELLCRSASQGVAAETIDRKGAWLVMERLKKAGLVSDIGTRGEKGGLTFKLPLSPIGAAGKLTQKAQPKTDATPSEKKDLPPLVEPVSVLVNTKDFNTPNTDFGAGEAGAAVPPFFEREEAPAALTTSYITDQLAAADFDFVHSGQSHRIYANWISQGLPRERFLRALRAVRNDGTALPRPDSIDAWLRGWKRRSIHRGRVAL